MLLVEARPLPLPAIFNFFISFDAVRIRYFVLISELGDVNEGADVGMAEIVPGYHFAHELSSKY